MAQVRVSLRHRVLTGSWLLIDVKGSFLAQLVFLGSQDSSVSIVTGVRFPAGVGIFSLHHRVQTGSGVNPDFYPMGTGFSYPGGKAAGREADHSSASSAEAKNAWSYTFTPP
jgi:hypothetical protein